MAGSGAATARPALWGAILDPIADKVLVCGVILGLLSLGPNAAVAIPAALILFREFTVSALREVAAGKGVSLPVTLLAKWKTTLQLVALGAELLVAVLGGLLPAQRSCDLGPATVGRARPAVARRRGDPDHRARSTGCRPAASWTPTPRAERAPPGPGRPAAG